jgi:DNA polymerase III sliding clamp (beta) subunit (PCNA family)
MFTVDHEVIKSLLIAMPKQDIRYYLVGALIDVRESDVTLVATDGHMLLAVPVPQQNIESAIPCRRSPSRVLPRPPRHP